jgi:hypothetical protein
MSGKAGEPSFLEDLVLGLRKRSRAINHRGAALEWERVREIEDGVEKKGGRLEIDVSYRVSAALVRMRWIVWPDKVGLAGCQAARQEWMEVGVDDGRQVHCSAGCTGVC